MIDSRWIGDCPCITGNPEVILPLSRLGLHDFQVDFRDLIVAWNRLKLAPAQWLERSL
jgi:hypothetical protein